MHELSYITQSAAAAQVRACHTIALLVTNDVPGRNCYNNFRLPEARGRTYSHSLRGVVVM